MKLVELFYAVGIRPRTRQYPFELTTFRLERDDDCAFEFQYSDPGFCNGGMFGDVDAMRHAHFFKLPVQGRNLARYLDAEFPAEAQRIRFSKVDTEGYDRTVIASLQPLIARSRPFITAEIYRHSPADERRRFWRDLHEAGYSVSRYGSDESYLGDPLTEDDMSRWSHFDIFAVPA